LRAAAAALGLAVLTAAPGDAREAPPKVLLAAPIGDDAIGTIAPEAWARYVTASLGSYQVIPFKGTADPSLDDCARAGAEYVFVATFERRPQLPGLATVNGRTAAKANRIARNCISGDTVVDDVVDFESDPPAPADGASASSSDAWEREIPAALAKNPIVLDGPARVLSVTPPLVRIGFRRETLHTGDVVSDVASAKNVRHPSQIPLTVTQVFDDYVVALFDTSGPTPERGDLVER